MQKTSIHEGGAASDRPRQVEAGVNKELAWPTSERGETETPTSTIPGKPADPAYQNAPSSQTDVQRARSELTVDHQSSKEAALKRSASHLQNSEGPLEGQTEKRKKGEVSACASRVEKEGAGSEEKPEPSPPSPSANIPPAERKDAEGQAGIDDGKDNKSASTPGDEEGSTFASLRDALEAAQKSMMTVLYDLKSYTAEPNESEAARGGIEAATAGVVAAVSSIQAAQKRASAIVPPQQALAPPTTTAGLSEAHVPPQRNAYQEASTSLSQARIPTLEQPQPAPLTTSRPHHPVGRKIQRYERITSQANHSPPRKNINADHYGSQSQSRHGTDSRARSQGTRIAHVQLMRKLGENETVKKWKQAFSGGKSSVSFAMRTEQGRGEVGERDFRGWGRMHPIKQDFLWHRTLRNAPVQQGAEATFMVPPGKLASTGSSLGVQGAMRLGPTSTSMLRCSLNGGQSAKVPRAEPWLTCSSQQLRNHRL